MTCKYLTLRKNPLYPDVVHLGITPSPKRLEAQYLWNELSPSCYSHVYQIQGDFDENEFLESAREHQISGRFYHETVVKTLYERTDLALLTQEEMDVLLSDRIQVPMQESGPPIKYEPRPYQQEIIRIARQYYATKEKGLLALICGVGKTLISLWIAESMDHNQHIVIGVPNLSLLSQWQASIRAVFPDRFLLSVASGVLVSDIAEAVLDHDESIVVATYASIHKITKACKEHRLKFDFKILDETHHLTCDNINLEPTSKKHVQALHIPARKQLALTATLKILDTGIAGKEGKVGNNSKPWYGDVICQRTLLWAIQQGIICDFVVQTMISTGKEYRDVMLAAGVENEEHQRLFLAAVAGLKSLERGDTHHILIYSNSCDNSELIIGYIRALLDHHCFHIPDIFFSGYYGHQKRDEQAQILDDFTSSPVGIIACVYCLGEGWDLPLLDGVVFGENMTSEIRIVQSALRACRKNREEPHKISKIILPVLGRSKWIGSDNNPELQNVKRIVRQMGCEDRGVVQKIHRFSKSGASKPKEDEEMAAVTIGGTVEEATGEVELASTSREEMAVPQPIARQDTKKRSRGTLGPKKKRYQERGRISQPPPEPKRIEYNVARALIQSLGVKTEADYYRACRTNEDLPIDPENYFGSRWVNWSHYLLR